MLSFECGAALFITSMITAGKPIHVKVLSGIVCSLFLWRGARRRRGLRFLTMVCGSGRGLEGQGGAGGAGEVVSNICIYIYYMLGEVFHIRNLGARVRGNMCVLLVSTLNPSSTLNVCEEYPTLNTGSPGNLGAAAKRLGVVDTVGNAQAKEKVLAL